jgi:hypothetical protein
LIKWVCRGNLDYLNTSDYGMDLNSFLTDEPPSCASDKAKDERAPVGSTYKKGGKKLKLPPGVSSQQMVRPDGSVVYNLTHKELGKLGRIVLEDAPHGSPYGMNGLLSYEIAVVSDGLEKPRKAMMEKIAKTVSAVFAQYAKGEIDIAREVLAGQQGGRGFPLDDMAALAALEAFLDIERHLKRPWPRGIAVEKTIDQEEHCLIYSYKHEKIGEVGRIVVLFRGDAFGLRPEIYLEEDGHRSEREALMTKIVGIMEESFQSRPEMRKRPDRGNPNSGHKFS